MLNVWNRPSGETGRFSLPYQTQNNAPYISSFGFAPILHSLEPVESVTPSFTDDLTGNALRDPTFDVETALIGEIDLVPLLQSRVN